MKDKDLAVLIADWFNSTSSKNSSLRRWTQTEVGKTIKANLLKCDHWKNARRGKPNTAFKKTPRPSPEQRAQEEWAE